MSEIIVFDCETTGIFCDSEILSLAIIDGFGNVLFDEYIKPCRAKKWPYAQRVNHISPEMVANKMLFEYHADKVQKIIDSSKLLVGYNIDFDIGFLERAGIVFGNSAKFDVMKEFSKIIGIGRYQKLVNCAEYYDYVWEGKPHGALADCHATLHCYREMTKNR